MIKYKLQILGKNTLNTRGYLIFIPNKNNFHLNLRFSLLQK